ncbi:MAG TPA: lipase family protein [Candidatus Corynebacterium gallistercoris]|uniref:Lipase family protein n=1 Tax=Candidatus Corynebacterium gallistercoris TaxID=2838530 RepID=A0A9D1UPP5_9CORY|nr:lipase family protein [Candidatus Corynebacterium gallistercoris]
MGVTAATTAAAQDASGSVLSSEPVPGVPRSSVDTGVAGSSFDPADPFYATPADVPTNSGALIRTQTAPHLLNLIGAPGPGQAQKILYSTKTQDDEPTVASGFVIEPIAPWTGKGPVPTVVFTPGTRGQADVCAPSRAVGLVANADLRNGAINVNYELPNMYIASAMGMRVVATDLIGLGTKDLHTFMNRAEQAHATLDAARAGLAAAGIPADSPIAINGYSQGGGAAAAAAELAGEYAPELNLKGTAAGAPPADLNQVMEEIDENAIAGVLGYSLNGYLQRRPDLESWIDERFNDKGKQFLADTKDRCLVDSVAAWGLTDTRTLTTDGKSFREIVDEMPELQEIINEQTIGNRPLNAPMLVSNGRHDDTIPYEQARTMARKFCEQGATVQFVTSEIPPILPKFAINHALPMLEQLPTTMTYLADRFNDVPAPSNCSRF